MLLSIVLLASIQCIVYTRVVQCVWVHMCVCDTDRIDSYVLDCYRYDKNRDRELAFILFLFMVAIPSNL